MNADDLRYRNDLEQANSLKDEREVKRVTEWLEKQEAEGSTGLRRQLLATSVRLSRKMAPDVYKLSDECVERLSMDTPLELYVFNSAQFNAMCFKPEEGRSRPKNCSLLWVMNLGITFTITTKFRSVI